MTNREPNRYYKNLNHFPLLSNNLYHNVGQVTSPYQGKTLAYFGDWGPKASSFKQPTIHIH
jgi:hypothetical protein